MLLFPCQWTGNPIELGEMKKSSLRNMLSSDLWESFHWVPRSTNNRILPVTAFISWGELGGKWFSCAVQVHFHVLKKLWVCNRMKSKPDSLCFVSVRSIWWEELPPPHPRVNRPMDYVLGAAGQHRDLTSGFNWLWWAPWPLGQEVPETFLLQLVLPLHIPSCCTPQTSCWTAWPLPRNIGRCVFTASFIPNKASLFKKQQKSFAT